MSRPPPSSLTPEDLMALAKIRKDIWYNGAQGFLVGGASSYLLYRATKFGQQRDWRIIRALVNFPLTKNHGFAGAMLGASLGSFLFAVTTGRNAVHTLHPVFSRGRLQQPDSTGAAAPVSYRDARDRARTYEDLRDIKNQSLSLARTRTQVRDQLMDDAEQPVEDDLQRNRLMRRESMSKSFQAGHGLSDSHGGHWVQDQFRKE